MYPLQRLGRMSSSRPWTTSRSSRSCSRCTTICAGRGSFVNLDNYRPEYLSIFSRDVLRRIAAEDESWEDMCPAEVAELIKRRGFFGYVKSRD